MSDFNRDIGHLYDRLTADIEQGYHAVFDEADSSLVAVGEKLCPGARYPSRNTDPLDPVAEAEAYAEYRWGKNSPDIDIPQWWPATLFDTYCVTNGEDFFFACTDPGMKVIFNKHLS